ncbi:sulfotransferase 4A1-like [Mercenaria mercenaria]|uniref:sulfotransferase 4A1-like n=1 Tax=Mercenaria mercenaria TaxID=6596 RepID=UPI00234F743D|nr:sulfotransferase 4A1-like [Mercenaria mercenaria]
MAQKVPHDELVKKLVLKVYKGVVMYDKANDEIGEIEQMDTREDDIWVCTFPRSGTTLTQEMVYLIQTLDFETANKVHLDVRFPQVEVHDEHWPDFKGLKEVEQRKSPRMIKSHLHHSLLPEQLRNGKGRIIYVCRNPKDVIISYFRWQKWVGLLVERNDTLEKCLDGIVNGTEYACPWPRHLLEYWERRNDKNVLFLRYEDIVADKPAAIRRIADFLGKPLSDENVAQITKHCHVDNMRNNPMVNLKYWEDYKLVNTNIERAHINKGKPGIWHDVLTEEQSKKIDKLIQELDGSGLEVKQT